MITYFNSKEFQNKITSYILKYYDLGIKETDIKFEYSNKGENTFYVSYTTDKLYDNMGVFKNVIEYYYYTSFGSAKLYFTEWNNEIYATSEMWFPNLNISYQSLSGGSNGMTVMSKNYDKNNSNHAFWFNFKDKNVLFWKNNKLESY